MFWCSKSWYSGSCALRYCVFSGVVNSCVLRPCVLCSDVQHSTVLLSDFLRNSISFYDKSINSQKLKRWIHASLETFR